MSNNSRMKSEEPLVSICTLAYNHEDFICQCLDGFIFQKTTFRFEVLIHDDASTDHTAAIIREYEEKYPDIIKPIYQKENQYSKGKGILAPYVYPHVKGKYIALCEGDDYWTDPHKLQKQVDFLEKNPEYILSNSDANFLYQESNYYVPQYHKRKGINNYSGSVSLQDILSGKYIIRTASVVMKKEYVLNYLRVNDFKEIAKYLLMGDTPLWYYLSFYGKFHYLEDATVTHRRRKGSASNHIDVFKSLKFTLSSFIFRRFCIEKNPASFSPEYKSEIIDRYNKAVINYSAFNYLDEIPFKLEESYRRRFFYLKKYKAYKILKRSLIKLRFKVFRRGLDAYYFLRRLINNNI